MKKDLNELKKLVVQILQSDGSTISSEEKTKIIEQLVPRNMVRKATNLLPPVSQPGIHRDTEEVHTAIITQPK